MTLSLYDWAWSPFCHKVRAVLEHKQIAYRRIDVMGNLRSFVDVWRRGTGKVPALLLEDKRLVSDSTAIAHLLEELYPEPAILPSDAAERAECHLLEDWADESLYFVNLYYQWLAPEGRRMLAPTFARYGLAGRLAHPFYQRMIERQLRGQGIGRKARAAVDADLQRHLDAIEARLGRGRFLLGELPRLCDFAWFSQLVYLGRHELGLRALAVRPRTSAYLERLAALYPQSLAHVDGKRFASARPRLVPSRMQGAAN